MTISAPMDQSGASAGLNLDRDSKWISSCFYTHSRGYKLCLALKSTVIGPYPMPRREHPYTRKPKLHIALVAISQEDDDHRSWPCEGEVTLRLLGQRECSPFVIKFSIKKPLTGLSEANILSNIGDDEWIQLPEEAIPFGQYFSPGEAYTTHDIPDHKLDIRIEAVRCTQ